MHTEPMSTDNQMYVKQLINVGSTVQFSSVTQLCPTLCDPMDCSTSGFPIHHNSQSLLKLMSIESVMPSNHLILCHPLFPLPSIFPSIRVFSNKSVLCIRQPKYWSFSFSISPSNEYSGLISFRIDWFDLLAVQETLKSLLQHHSSKSINSSVLSFLYSPTLTSIHDYWKNYSFDKMDLCQLYKCWLINIHQFGVLNWYLYIKATYY